MPHVKSFLGAARKGLGNAKVNCGKALFEEHRPHTGGREKLGIHVGK